MAKKQNTAGPEKSAVRQMFNDIAPRYDLLNSLLSFGTHMLWKRRVIKMLRKHPVRDFLDVATGTADLAMMAARLRPEKIFGVDISPEMLSRGRDKIRKKGMEKLVKLMIADSEVLPFLDDSFDAVTVGFGVRNFENLDKGLSELHRVLRPGGMVLILEFSLPQKKVLRKLYFLYFLHILPLIGRMVSRHRRAYYYLPESVCNFPSGGDFLRILEKAGFTQTGHHPLAFGIASIYKATK